MEIVKIDGIHTKIYLHKYANFYVFTYVLKRIFDDCVEVPDWNESFPDIDRSVELNIFWGEKRQIKEWLMNEQFCFTKLITYDHKYFFVEKRHSLSFNKLIKNKSISGKYKITIFTNIRPEVERFKKKEILDKIFKNGATNLDNIDIMEEDILFNRDFVSPILEKDKPQNDDKIFVYFYGTPLNDILACRNKKGLKNAQLKLVRKNTELKGDTYLCFMVNTGKLQPKHIALIRKFVDLFRVCDEFAKKKGILTKELKKFKNRFRITREKVGELKEDNVTKEHIIDIKFSVTNNSGKGQIVIVIDEKNEIRIKLEHIRDAFKQSFNLRFLEDDVIEIILQQSAKHNEISKDYRFGCSEEEL